MRPLQLEWLKFRKSNLFIVVGILYLLILPTILMITTGIKEVPPPLPDPSSLYTFPLLWDTLAYGASWLNYYLIGILCIYFITSEYNYKTTKQNIIQGLTRSQYFTGKVSLLLALVFAAWVAFVLVGLIFGFSYSENYESSSILGNEKIQVRFILNALGFGSLGLFFGFLVRRTGAAILLYLGYTFFIEWAFRRMVHMKILGSTASGYYPYKAHSDLAPLPYLRDASDTLGLDEFGFQYLEVNEAIIISFIYSLLLCTISYFIFKRRDL